ncbi:MAG: tyrosine-type recombinase/integrase [Candidatus Accumulibacter sp.]|jgi:integrase|nr:tyrosine-type recombinase/integrase [Accumulibacter sp.]
MPKKARELTQLQLDKAIREMKANSKRGKIAVGGVDGLYLFVSLTGATYWILLYPKGTRINGKGETVTHRVSTALYSIPSNYPTVGLKQARERARQLRHELLKGNDPAEKHRHERLEKFRAENQKTFAQCAEVIIEQKKRELSNLKAALQWRSTMQTYVFPVIGERKINEITKHDIVRILEPIWHTKTKTATQLRGKIATVFDYAKAMEYCEGENPASWKGTLEPILGQPKRVVKHLAALPYPQIGPFMEALRREEGMAARALEFSILTATRSGEVRHATWDEIDFEAKTWTIPAERMKARKEHPIPLSEAAIDFLQTLKQNVLRSETWLFPSPYKKDAPLKDPALINVMNRMGWTGLTQHGFRSTFRDWAGEQTPHAREVIEHALAHQLKDKSEAAYQRGTLWPKRIVLMNDWANYCGMRSASPES